MRHTHTWRLYALLILVLSACGSPPEMATNDAQATNTALQATNNALSTAVAQPAATQAPTAPLAPTDEPPTATLTVVPATPTDAPSPTLAASPTATLSPTVEAKAGDVLYEAKWSEDSTGWSVGERWRVLNGMLVSASYAPPIFIPYELTTPDYAVEAAIQVVSWDRGSANFGLITRRLDEEGGYKSGVSNSWCGFGMQALVTAEYFVPSCAHGALKSVPFDLDEKEHVHRVEMQGNTIRYFIDGTLLIEEKSNVFLDPGKVGLWTEAVQIEVHSLKVTKL